ncbi:MAG TPA: DUF4350 domain-containing protein [Gemmatimonadaceae bacterium]|nr:DUF4350 domain-containing protein [Gemmatimonadaceae bacterium]
MADGPAPRPAPGGRLDQWLAPRTVFRVVAIVAAIVVAAELLVRQTDPAEGDPRPTTWSYAPKGARGFYEVVGRLGWAARRSEVPLRAPLDSAATYVVLASDEDLTGREVGALLAAVRRGAGLMFVPDPSSTLADSLGIVRRPTFGTLETAQTAGAADSAAAPDTTDDGDSADATEFGEGYDDPDVDAGVRWYLRFRRPPPPDTTVFVRALAGGTERPVLVGVPLGRGRLVALADPHVLRNESVRDDEGGVLPVRLVEYATPPGGAVVFDEYHNGYGRHASVTRAIGRLLRDTPGGRTIAQLAVAALVLLVAAGARAITPRSRLRLERRSPFEHVGALAQAYEQAGATRVASRRLLRGLRRRHPAALKGEDDEAALRRLTTRFPALGPAAAALVAAARTPLAPREFRTLAEHVDAIERTLAAP